ncbi:MAG TPA: DUF4139 domain-containing protein [Chitinophagaceae bacterium]
MRIPGLLFLLTITISVRSQDNIPVRSQLTAANVYYGYGAELTHTAKASLQKGTQEITIENISTSVDPNTIRISVPEDVVLLSYRFNTRATVLNQVNPAIKKTEDSVKQVQKQSSQLNNESLVVNDMLEKTTKLIETYTASPNKSLSTADLIRLLDFYTGKIQAYRSTLFSLQERKQELAELMAALQQRLYLLRQENNGNASKITGEMILQLVAQQSAAADFGITYFTRNAGWIPTYDMRVRSEDNSFRLVYKGSVTQTTGLDWKQVKLTLSTSNPNLGNTYPTLNPLFLQVYNPEIYKQMQGRAAAANMNTVQSLDEVVVSAYGIKATNEEKEEDDSDVGAYLTLSQNQLNTSFEINLPYDIPGDGKACNVAIRETPVQASYKHYAAPRVDKDAFLLAEVSNWEQLDLLPGDANIIVDNVYLGKSFIDPNTTNDTLNVSLGRDKRVAVKRVLVKEFSKARVRGDNKTETYTWEITVRNNKSKDAAMLLKDQVPVSRMKDVVVKLENDGDAEVNEELGILNWKISLKPGETKKFRFSYSVTYPKNQKITNLR